MIGLDTNILARFFAQDDPKQSRCSDELLQSLTPEEPGFISLVSFIELVWVLRSQYRLNKAQLIQCLERLLDSHELIVESHGAVTLALYRFATANADLADCLIERCGRLAGCSRTFTFDAEAAKSAGMILL
jgi:predicted nucleic-acid-binding protein